MINEFWTKWQLWPKNAITHTLQCLYNLIYTLVLKSLSMKMVALKWNMKSMWKQNNSKWHKCLNFHMGFTFMISGYAHIYNKGFQKFCISLPSNFISEQEIFKIENDPLRGQTPRFSKFVNPPSLGTQGFLDI